MMGAREVLASCAGWLMVSASRITSCSVLASSNILSISLWTSAAQTRHIQLKLTVSLHQHFSGVVMLTWPRPPRLERVLDLSIMGLLLRTDLLAKDRSAVTRVIEILMQIQRGKIWCETFFQSQPKLQRKFCNLSILPTFPQICVSGSQKELSASYPSPGKEEEREKTEVLNRQNHKPLKQILLYFGLTSGNKIKKTLSDFFPQATSIYLCTLKPYVYICIC